LWSSVRDDGGVLAAAINAVCLALVDAGLACRSLFSAVAISKTTDGRMLLDPTASEEKAAGATLTLAYCSRNLDGIFVSHVSGKSSDDFFRQASAAAQKACEKIEADFRNKIVPPAASK